MATSRMTSVISKSGAARGQYFRPVERFVHHGAPVEFRSLCERAIPASTRYLVLDLDRTLHLGRNMGELLGWETAAYHSYGPEHLAAVEAQRGQGRFLIDLEHPIGTAKYVYRGARGWAYPGLFYLLWGRMAGATGATRRLRARRFGSDAYLYVQTWPNLALLHDLTGMTMDEARELSARVFRRQAPDQVIARSDVEWLRQRCPGIQIILSSASPQPAVEAAAHELGIDALLFTEIDVKDGRISAPYQTTEAFLRNRAPHRISPPSAYHVNSGRNKIDRLVARYPDILDAETVGITDTWHGDDHCWAHHFRRVIDINSISPFSPLVAIDSPVCEIHSAHVLTVEERDARARGDEHFVSARRERLPTAEPCERTAAAIVARVAKQAAAAEVLAARYDELRATLAGELAEVEAQRMSNLARIEDVVSSYNLGSRSSRRRLLRSLAKLTRQQERIRRRKARVECPLSDVALALSDVLDEARNLSTDEVEDELWSDVYLTAAVPGPSGSNAS